MRPPNAFRCVNSDCGLATTQMWVFLDGECPPELDRTLVDHIGVCQGCWAHYMTEARIKKMIATKCGGEHAPERLHRYWSTRGADG